MTGTRDAVVRRAGAAVPSVPPDDARGVYRITVDVLALPAQIEPLVTVLGTAVCGAPDDHVDACRIAWRIGVAGPDRDEPVAAVDEQEVRTALTALEVWDGARATADLRAEACGAERTDGVTTMPRQARPRVPEDRRS